MDNGQASIVKRKKYAPPLKDIEDINRILDYFISKKQYRDLLLFTLGINFGIRCDDLLKLKFRHIVNIDGTIKHEVNLVEEGNKNHRICYMNDFIANAIKMYVNSITSSGHKIDLNDFIFTSQSNNNSKAYYDTLLATGKNINRGVDKPLTIKTVNQTLKEVINDSLGINVHIGIHLMRKAFAYQVIANASDRGNAIKFIQLVLGLNSCEETSYYAGTWGCSETIKKVNFAFDFYNSVGIKVTDENGIIITLIFNGRNFNIKY